MKLLLSGLALDDVVGIYGPRKVTLPDRMRFLHPQAAWAYLEHLTDYVVCSDMFRSPEASMQAVAEGRGALPPSYSGHNYGFSIDIAVDRVMKNLGLKKKVELDRWMVEKGWYCFWRDGRRGKEDWHYNFFTPAEAARFIERRETSTRAALERKIKAVYGGHFKLTAIAAQGALAKLRLYNGALDGVFGNLSKQALMAFQRTWRLRATAELDPNTMRLLAYCTADREYVDPEMPQTLAA